MEWPTEFPVKKLEKNLLCFCLCPQSLEYKCLVLQTKYPEFLTVALVSIVCMYILGWICIKIRR